MFKDKPKIVIERILKDKDKQYLDFEYKGETNKDKQTPHGRGHKEFKLDYKSGIYYDLENLLCSSHIPI